MSARAHPLGNFLATGKVARIKRASLYANLRTS